MKTDREVVRVVDSRGRELGKSTVIDGQIKLDLDGGIRQPLCDLSGGEVRALRPLFGSVRELMWVLDFGVR